MTSSKQFEFRRSRDFGESFSGLFEFIRYNFKNLSKSLIYIAGPFTLILGIVYSFLIDDLTSSFQIIASGNIDYLENTQSIAFKSFFLIFAYCVSSTLILGIVCEYILFTLNSSNKTEQFTVVMLLEKIKENFWRHIGSFLVLNFSILLILIPFALLFWFISLLELDATINFLLLVSLSLTTIYFSVYTFCSLTLFPIMRTVEEIEVIDGIKRCFYLIKDMFWQTFGFYMVVGIIQATITYVFEIPDLILLVINELGLTSHSSETVFGYAENGLGFSIALIAAHTISFTSSILLASLSLAANSLQYFNLVEQKEGVGMMSKLELIGSPVSHSENADTDDEY